MRSRTWSFWRIGTCSRSCRRAGSTSTTSSSAGRSGTRRPRTTSRDGSPMPLESQARTGPPTVTCWTTSSTSTRAASSSAGWAPQRRSRPTAVSTPLAARWPLSPSATVGKRCVEAAHRRHSPLRSCTPLGSASSLAWSRTCRRSTTPRSWRAARSSATCLVALAWIARPVRSHTIGATTMRPRPCRHGGRSSRTCPSTWTAHGVLAYLLSSMRATSCAVSRSACGSSSSASRATCR
mmetsp:Transcript_65530/g.188904  ORF Transcript_65530/g.188904 Transcript_65530/m.188904 type:complete len:237 (+) Transcript_65530:1918-2628(+)